MSMSTLDKAPVVMTTGVKGGIGKSITASLFVDYFSRLRGLKTVVVNCDARITTIEKAYRKLDSDKVQVLSRPLFDDRTYETILRDIDEIWASWRDRGGEEEDKPRLVVDMPGQNEGMQHLEFVNILVEEYGAAILWLMAPDAACVEALSAALAGGMRKPVPTMPGIELRPGIHDETMMNQWLTSKVRKEYGYENKNEFWVERLPENLLQPLKENEWSVQAIVERRHPFVTSLTSRSFGNYMNRFAERVAKVEVELSEPR